MPTFGITTGGGSTFPTTNDRAILSKFTAPASGTLTQINQRFHSSSAAGDNFKGLIYSDSGGVPGTRLGIGSAVSVPAGGGDLASTGLSVSITGGVDYWIGSVVDAFNSVWECDAGGTGLSRMESCTYSSPAATWTQSGTGVATVNVYATYVSGPTITQQPISQRLPVGGSPVFTVGATGTGGLSYQWYSNASGSFVAVGTNSATYSPAALSAGDRYDVYCDVTDSISTTRTMYAAAWAPSVEPAPWRGLYSRGSGRDLVRGFGLVPNGKAGALAMADALLGPAVAAGGATLTPGTGHLTLTGRAPTVLQPLVVSPGTGHLTLTGRAPSILVAAVVAPGTGHLVLTGYAPTVTRTANQSVAPGKGALTLTGYAPTLTRTTVLAPGTGHLLLGTYAPTIARLTNVAPGTGHLLLTGYAPSIVRITALTPGTGHLTLTGYAPTVAQSSAASLTPGTGHLTTAGYAPTVTRTDNQAATPGTGHLSFAGYAPLVTRTTVLVPGVGHLVVTGYAPSLLQSVTVAPGTGHLLLTGYAPSVVRTANQSVTPGTGHLVLAGYSPAVSNGGAVWPAPADVRAGVVYGPTGTEYTGTLVGGGGSYLRRR